MRNPLVRPLLPLALAALLALAACDASPGPTSTPTAGTDATPITAPTLTPVPGGQSGQPDPLPTRVGTTQADWGEILVSLPATFPLLPGAERIDLPEVASASLSAPVDVAEAVSWYNETLVEMGYRVEVSDPLEDGSQTLDAFSDLPECRIQIVFRPEADSTIITVLYGAGCAGVGS